MFPAHKGVWGRMMVDSSRSGVGQVLEAAERSLIGDH